MSQSGAVYDGDEGLHLVAVLLVRDGRLPFADFFYWHEPVYLYVASAWMAVVGESWRSLHLLSALLTAASTVLVARLASAAMPGAGPRSWWPVVAASLFALNVLVVKWGTIAHNYALCLVFGLLAVLTALRAVERPERRAAFWSGIWAGAATATSLLVAPLAPVLLIWITRYSGTSTVRRQAAAFAGGALLPFVPLMVLAWRAPYQTFFGLVAHHLVYRVSLLEDPASQWDVLRQAAQSPQAWLLAGFGIASGWLLRRGVPAREVDVRVVVLCAALTVALGLFVTASHPPVHAVYFVVVAPFVAVLAAVGAWLAARQRSTLLAERAIVCGVVGVFAAGLAASAYRERLWVSEWARIERFAEEVGQVTPVGGSFYTSYPFVYFAARLPPPAGLENGWASQMSLAPDTFSALKLAAAGEVAARVRHGEFDSVLLWRDDARFDATGLDRLYLQSKALDRHFVLRWARRSAAEPAIGE